MIQTKKVRTYVSTMWKSVDFKESRKTEGKDNTTHKEENNRKLISTADVKKKKLLILLLRSVDVRAEQELSLFLCFCCGFIG